MLEEPKKGYSKPMGKSHAKEFMTRTLINLEDPVTKDIHLDMLRTIVNTWIEGKTLCVYLVVYLFINK